MKGQRIHLHGCLDSPTIDVLVREVEGVINSGGAVHTLAECAALRAKLVLCLEREPTLMPLHQRLVLLMAGKFRDIARASGCLGEVLDSMRSIDPPTGSA